MKVRFGSMIASVGVVVGLLGTAGPAQAQSGRPPSLIIQAAQGTAFTYQGQLRASGVPASGTYDFQFTLHDAAAAGTTIGSVTRENITVTNGLFTVQLDFGATAFEGDARYLQVAVRPGSSAAAYTALVPRQTLNAAPYALSLRPGAVISNPSTTGEANGVVGEISATQPGGFSAGVRGINNGIGGLGIGVYGSHAGSGWGVYGASTSGIGVNGYAGGSTGASYGVFGQSASADGYGGFFLAPNTTSSGAFNRGVGVVGLSGVATTDLIRPAGSSLYPAGGEFVGNNGLIGVTTASTTDGYGVTGVASGIEGTGVYASATAETGLNYGVRATVKSDAGRAVYAQAVADNGQNFGVYATSASPSGIGVQGWHLASSGTAAAVRGDTASTSANAVGVLGQITSTAGGSFAAAVRGNNNSTGGNGIGVYGGHAGGGYGVFGTSVTGSGIVGNAGATGTAGTFFGKVDVTGNLSKGAGSFKIDHPLDPTNKYLYHSFVESPDMLNIYNGNVTLDADGNATVSLPTWFQALNMEFRYQLTPIGAPGPNLYVAAEVSGNQFKIAGGAPKSKVSWQLTGIRQDPYAQAHRIPVEQDKSADERGTYLYPTEAGQPASLGLNYEMQQAAVESLRTETLTTPAPAPQAQGKGAASSPRQP